MDPMPIMGDVSASIAIVTMLAERMGVEYLTALAIAGAQEMING